MSEIKKREELPPLERAVSDSLDEYMIREHGIFQSWANADDFIEFLRGHGYEIVPIPGLSEEI